MKSFLVLLLLFPLLTNAQMEVKKIRPIPNRDVQYSNNISEGALIKDLSWAWKNNQPCFF